MSGYDKPNYGFGSAPLQATNNWKDSWGAGGFDLDAASSKFGEYSFGDNIDAPNVSSLGSAIAPGAELGFMDQFKNMLTPAAGSNGAFGGMLGQTQNGITTQGWGGMALGAASALGNAYLGMKQYGLAKETLKHNKEMFSKNFDAQKRTTNASLEDRQRSRVASNAGAYESVSSYMDKNGVR